MKPHTTATPFAWLAPLLVLLWLLAAAWNLSQWLIQPSDLAWSAKLWVKDVTYVALWTSGWAWVTQVLLGRPRLAAHISLAAGISLFDELVLSLCLPWLFFALGWPWPQGLHKILWIGMVVCAGLLHLQVAAGGLNRNRIFLWALASAFALGLYLLHTWAEVNDHEALKKLPYESNIYPAVWVKPPPLALEEGLKELWARDWMATLVDE